MLATRRNERAEPSWNGGQAGLRLALAVTLGSHVLSVRLSETFMSRAKSFRPRFEAPNRDGTPARVESRRRRALRGS